MATDKRQEVLIGNTVEAGVLILALLVFYTYVGYPCLLWIGAALRRRQDPPADYYPRLSILIPAHNEESFIGDCLRSVQASSYPLDRLDVLVVSDGSTDGTNAIVESFQACGVRLVALPERRGKDLALASVRDKAASDILVIMDASGSLEADSIRRLVRHFQDPTVGSVVGAKTIVQTGTSVSRSDGLYWRYDSMLRTLESRNGSSWVGVEGGLFAIRKELFRFNADRGLSVDLALGGRVCSAAQRNCYDPTAVVWEPASRDIGVEFKRKVRVIVRGIRAFFFYWKLLNPVARPGFFFQNVSHKLLRWLVPFFLLGVLAGCLASTHWLMQFLLFVQAAFYSAALAGAVFRRPLAGAWVISIPLYFCSMNAAAFIAWFLVLRRFDIWDRTHRSPVADCPGDP